MLVLLLGCGPKYPDFDAWRWEQPTELFVPAGSGGPLHIPDALQVPEGVVESLSGTRWMVTTAEGDSFEVSLRRGQLLLSDNPQASAEDSWYQVGPDFGMSIGPVEYTGRFASKDLLEGSATSPDGELRWSALRAAVRYDPVDLGSLSPDKALAARLLGTRWQLEDHDRDEPVDMELLFDEGGRLVSSVQGLGEPRWAASEGQVYLHFNDDAAELVLVVQDDEHLEGTGTNYARESWDVSLTRLHD